MKNNTHASLKVHTINGDMVMRCSCCGMEYDINTLECAQKTGRCVFCGAILDGEEKNEVQKNEHIE